MSWVDYILLVISIFIIVIVLLQHSSDDLAGAFSGESNELFKNRKAQGLEKGLSITTAVLIVIFVGLAVASRFITK